jgi:hypothetical protein
VITLRFGAGIGLVITAVSATWWLTCMHPALAGSSLPAQTAAQAALGLWLGRAIVLMVLASRLGVLLEPRRAMAIAAALIATAWPLLVLLRAADAASASMMLSAEAILLVLAGACTALGRVLARMPGPPDTALVVATAAGGFGAALLLAFREEYLTWIGWVS